jgi:hypothetical protein
MITPLKFELSWSSALRVKILPSQEYEIIGVGVNSLIRYLMISHQGFPIFSGRSLLMILCVPITLQGKILEIIRTYGHSPKSLAGFSPTQEYEARVPFAYSRVDGNGGHHLGLTASNLEQI